MTRPARWWEAGEHSVEAEEARFGEAGLAFSLDRRVFDQHGVVVFHGQLRFGDERCGATVVYPTAYGADRPAAVFAPTMPIDSSHKREGDGLLCLDHTVFGELAPMTGAEAVERAEELWRLTVEDPEALRAQAIDLPLPRIERYVFEEKSAVFLLAANVQDNAEGWIRLGVATREPFRGAIEGLGAGLGAPPDRELEVHNGNNRFGGRAKVLGFWRRCDEAPGGADAAAVMAWALEHHGDLVERAKRYAAAHRAVVGSDLPALVTFIFPDDGPGHEPYDAWLPLLIDSDGTARLPQPVPIGSEDQWTRQPQLQPLGTKKVGVIGLGALGSQVATHLARAGLGRFVLIDPDRVTPGIVVRHALDLAVVGYTKVDAVGEQLLSVNPWTEPVISRWEYGGAPNVIDPAGAQSSEDTITDALYEMDLIVEASAHTATGYYVSSVGDASGLPVLHVAVSSGAWGARIILQRPGLSGCLECLARHQEFPVAGSPEIPPLAEDPEHAEVLERGCAQTTFTAPGFELAAAAAAAARCAVQILLDGNGYPMASFDLVTLNFRNATSAESGAIYSPLPRHPNCSSCRG